MGDRPFLGLDYLRALRAHYPEQLAAGTKAADRALSVGIIDLLSAREEEIDVDPPDRLVPFARRSFAMADNAWRSTFLDDARRIGARIGYHGLVNLKPPSDLVLYTNLLWELQPRTVIELGALQGGSALWFAHQLDAIGGEREVHSFELLDRCVHPTAKHPRLRFHQADLTKIETLDEELIRQLPHPWLVVDDAHVNVFKVAAFFGQRMEPGDYYVLEDLFVVPEYGATRPDVLPFYQRLCAEQRFVVDTKYTDAFGYNVTCAPNAWWRKS